MDATTPAIAVRTRPVRTQTGRGAALRRAIKPALYVVGMIPAAWALYLGLTDQLGADPVKALEHTLGLWSLRFLIAGLSVTPLRRLGGPNLIGYRRAAGLLAFAYAVLHVIVYAWLDQDLNLSAILGDILKRPYITIGLAALLILLPLAVTSNDLIIRRMGAAAWQRLHRWVYLAVAAAALHFIMVVKGWQTEPMVYGLIVLTLLAWRVKERSQRRARRVRAHQNVNRQS